MEKERQSFDDWCKEFEELADPIIINEMVMRDYFYQGLSPDEALSDYLS